MIRERRYTIFKHADVEKHLNENEIVLLCELESKINFARQQENRGLLTAVVVEKDWPEYEPTWAMIEARVDGSAHSAAQIPARSDLAACHCGRPIDDLIITDAGQGGKYMSVYGNCCGEWMIEFRTSYAKGDELMALAKKAWNAAPRAS